MKKCKRGSVRVSRRDVFVLCFGADMRSASNRGPMKVVSLYPMEIVRNDTISIVANKITQKSTYNIGLKSR